MVWFVICSIMIMVLDQMLKIHVKNTIPVDAQVDTFLPFLKLSNVRNSGVAFGALRPFSILMIFMVMLIIVFFCYLIFVKKRQEGLFLISASFIIGGGLSNLIDRVFFKYVTDYISLSFFAPVCNLADYFICIGAILLIIYYFKTPDFDPKHMSK